MPRERERTLPSLSLALPSPAFKMYANAQSCRSSPTSSVGSEHAPASIDAFLGTRSRVVRVFGQPDNAVGVFCSPSSKFPRPTTMWGVQYNAVLWAVFGSHDEACTALSLAGLSSQLSLAPALESDLEPFHKLHRVEMNVNASRAHEFTLSSNPPNPRTSFRLGDWICASPKCAAHNFGRNIACIGCGCPRTNSTPTYQVPPPLASPRFTSSPSSQTSFSPSSPGFPSPKPAPAHPLLTPSGRSFTVGGRVQNISTDPLNPCIMYWPDNEPFPEQGQIRPNGLVGLAPPPILNTGNRGPISHQPGDWVCQKCNYLNWRRRKVCQTCLPYAEGNGDSISAAVQAERIALLTNVLAKTHRSHSMTPPQVHRPFIRSSSPAQVQVHRSQSHFDLGTQYHPIYQTSGHGHLHAPAPAPLLPSFLQHSPIMLSPVSTSSADLSLDEYDLHPEKSVNNIWKMDGDECTAIQWRN